MKNLFDIRGRVVVVTGGAGILGRSICVYLAEQGARVAVLDRDEKAGEALVGEIRAAGGDALFFATDVLNREVLVSNREAILGAWGQIDILLNAAGGNMGGATIAPDKSFLDLEIEAFRKVVDLNLFGTVLPTTVFGEAMTARRKGVIVNFCSESALRPLTRVVGYGAAKAAIANYTKYMAAELAMKFSPEMRVNAIVPGFLLTNQNRALLTNEDGSYTDRARTIIAHTPAGRFAEPEELLGTIHYLVSDASSFVTGALAVVDGGFYAFSILSAAGAVSSAGSDGHGIGPGSFAASGNVQEVQPPHSRLQRRKNNRGLRPRGTLYFLAAKSTKNSPADACAYFVPSNAGSGRLFAGAHVPRPLRSRF